MADATMANGGVSVTQPAEENNGTTTTTTTNITSNHMPPPAVPPLSIPQNTNPTPTAVDDLTDLISPTTGAPRRAAPEPNKRALYVGGLDTRVTEEVLKQIFETTGHVQNVKIIPDKNVSHSYACVSHLMPGLRLKISTVPIQRLQLRLR